MSDIEFDSVSCDKTPPKINVEISGETKTINSLNWYYNTENTKVMISVEGKINEYKYYLIDLNNNVITMKSGTTVGFEKYEHKLNDTIKNSEKYGKDTAICAYAKNRNDIEETVCKKINIDFTKPTVPKLIASDNIGSGKFHYNKFNLNISGGNSPSGYYYMYGVVSDKINAKLVDKTISNISGNSKKNYYKLTSKRITMGYRPVITVLKK